MASFNYTKAAATADKLITKFGASMVLNRSSNSGTASQPNYTDTPYTVVAVELNTNDEIDGVRRTRATFLISPGATVTPQSGDVITNPDGEKHHLFKVNTLKPAGTKVLFKAYAGTE